jgi:ectoine hydroxylase-related dioxygenase (phytanoyl-CoA dioxygenase family)
LDWLATVREQGYGLLPKVFPKGEIAALIEELDRTPLPRSRAGVRHAMRHPAIARMARDPRLVGMARVILGQTAFAFRATLFEKLPASNWLVAWHQDTALPMIERREVAGWGPWSVKEGVHYAHAPASSFEQVLALRVHLDDSTPENGPLRVVPGTHSLGVLTDDQIHTAAEGAAAIDCLMELGGVSR